MYLPDIKHINLTHRGRDITLRRSLFWDLDPANIDPEKNIRLILERVFTRGNIEEFRDIQAAYTKKEIKTTIVQIGSLDQKTLIFLSKNYNLPISDFKCYTPKP